MKKNMIPQKYKKRVWFLAMIVCVCTSWLWLLYVPYERCRFSLLSYVSPTMVVYAIAVVAFFLKLEFGCKVEEMIAVFSPAAFGVYLIHAQWLVSQQFLNDQFAWIAGERAWKIPLEVLKYSAVIFVVCLSIEKVRLSVFKMIKKLNG